MATMTNAGELLFGKMPSFPAVWMLGLLGFTAFWWYVWRGVRSIRRLFLVLWLPAGIMAGAVYSLEGRGYGATESLGGLFHRDPALLQLVQWIPSNGFAATYAVIVGAAVAAFATVALQLVGLVAGVLLGLWPSAGTHPRRRPPAAGAEREAPGRSRLG